MTDVTLENYRLLQELYLMLDDSDRHVLRAFGLTNRQYHALQHLPPGTNRHLTEMSELLFCDKSNITGLVERMVRDGLVTRDRSDSDRRYLELSITNKGDTQRMESREALESAVHRRFTILSDAEQDQLQFLLQKLASGLRDYLDHSDSSKSSANSNGNKPE